MVTIGSPTFLEICNSLRTKRGYAFELIHPHMFSLTLQAVWFIDEGKAATLIKHIFRKGSVKQDFLALLAESLTTAITLPSIQILKTTIARIEQKAMA